MCVLALAGTTTYAGERNIEADKASVSANKRNASSSFSWTKERKLSWDDFRGPIGREFGEQAAAATYCGFGFEAGMRDGATHIEVYNLFQPDKSWAKHEHKSASVLAHEQCHFDICELFTRRLKVRLQACTVSSANMHGRLNEVYDQVRAEYMAYQSHYEHETEHGVIPEVQKEWEAKIALELAQTEEGFSPSFTLRK